MAGQIARGAIAAAVLLADAGVLGATYRLRQISRPGELVTGPNSDAIPGLHVGSMLAFKANCVNVDISGITDAAGTGTVPGALFALVADEPDASLGPTEPKVLHFLQQDGTQPFPFVDGRFDWVMAEHFIEHVPFGDAVKFLTEVRRVLRPGGTLRLSTPDLAIYAAAFFDPAKRFFSEHYKLMTAGPGMEGNKAFMSPRPADMFNQIFYNYGHKHIYDEAELRAAAELAGWTAANGCSVVRATFQQGRDGALARLDDAVHSDESLYVDMFCGPREQAVPVLGYR